MQLAESAKAQFSSRDYSDHLALVRAYDGWKDAEMHQSGYEYCWKNFLSAQTLKAIDSLRKQFFYLLKDTGLLDNTEICNTWSHDEHLIRAIICAGLFPGICSVVVSYKLAFLSGDMVFLLFVLFAAICYLMSIGIRRTLYRFSWNSSFTPCNLSFLPSSFNFCHKQFTILLGLGIPFGWNNFFVPECHPNVGIIY